MLFFSRWPGTVTAHTPKFEDVQHKRTFERRQRILKTCVSSEKKLILARIGLYGDYQGRDFTICQKYRAQLGVRFRPSGHKNWKGKVKREVNLKMEKEIKAGGESSWWQGDYKPNRTRTVTVISESMNKEEGKEECLSEHQFS